jgi:hypothetical protein
MRPDQAVRVSRLRLEARTLGIDPDILLASWEDSPGFEDYETLLRKEIERVRREKDRTPA